MNTKQAIEQNPILSDAHKQFLLNAICTRGKYKGYLLANAPSARTRPEGWLAWQVLVSNLAPARVAAWSLMFSDQGDKFKGLDDAVNLAGLQFALNACEPAFRWNLWANRYNRDKAQAMVPVMYEEYRKKHA